VLDGFKLVEDSLVGGANIFEVYVDEEIVDKTEISRLLKEAANKDIKTFVCEKNVISKMAPTAHSQGVLALAKVGLEPLESVKTTDTVFVLDSIGEPGNLGAVIRSVVAANSANPWSVAVIITGSSCDVFNPRTIRASAGGIFNTKIICENSIGEVAKFLKKEGFFIIATSLSGSVSLFNAEFGAKVAVILGNEARGLSGEVIDLADTNVYIPMSNLVDSLNVAVAASLVAYEIERRRRNW
jgi:TrmH family RNA methyltransferase